ncbi:MAG: hypothetical protein JNJ54_36660 [Myxococcaceae bacterium]|nr:hypothetical protein [Myxococcaceae bacterium]
MSDPFSADADPDPPGQGLARRDLLVLAPATAAFVSSATGCVTLRLGCAPRPDDERSCQHRFCRYFRSSER